MHRASERGQGDPSTPGQRFRRADRLKKRFEFRGVQLRGRRIHTAHFLIVLQPNLLANTRLGITVTKKVGNAVQRNRVKRVVREVFRTHRALFPRGHDVVFIAKKGAPELGYDALLAEVRGAADRLKARRTR